MSVLGHEADDGFKAAKHELREARSAKRPSEAQVLQTRYAVIECEGGIERAGRAQVADQAANARTPLRLHFSEPWSRLTK